MSMEAAVRPGARVRRSPSARRAESPDQARIYQGGNLSDLEGLWGIGGERVLYVGGHIYGDILRSKKSSLWRTCMVVEELETEVAWLEKNQPALVEASRLEELRLDLDDEASGHKTGLNVLDRRLEKEFTFGFGKVGIFADVFNILGNQYVSVGQNPGGTWRPTDNNTSQGTYTVSSTYGRVTGVTGVRVFKFSARFTF